MDKKRIYYVYEYVDPRNNSVFYVGKGKGKRMYAHILPSKLKIQCPLSDILNGILSAGLRPTIRKIKKNLTETQSLKQEKE